MLMLFDAECVQLVYAIRAYRVCHFSAVVVCLSVGAASYAVSDGSCYDAAASSVLLE